MGNNLGFSIKKITFLSWPILGEETCSRHEFIFIFFARYDKKHCMGFSYKDEQASMNKYCELLYVRNFYSLCICENNLCLSFYRLRFSFFVSPT